MSKHISKSTILVTLTILLFSAYALGFLDPVIEWAKETLTLEGQTGSIVDQILR